MKKKNKKNKCVAVSSSGSHHWHKWRGVGGSIAWRARSLKRRAQRRFGDESVLHINAHTLLVHPTFAIVWVVGEIEGVLLSWGCRLVIPLVRP
jgi:hypothetical protein